MIGYYIHHVGRGHLSRATAIAAAATAAQPAESVTGLSTLPRPSEWPGAWLPLPPDDTPAVDPSDPAVDVAAGGRLHWAPLQHPGLSERMSRISAWIASAKPSVMVSDVSVEVALLARLHGIPVVTIALPGRRDDDPHRLGYAISAAILSAWPPEAVGMVGGLDESAAARHIAVGAISRFPTADPTPTAAPAVPASTPTAAPSARRRVLVLNGSGGGAIGLDSVNRASRSTPDWEWDLVGGAEGRWVENPWPLLQAADVIVTHAGQNAIAEVAAARRPAVIIPQPRPHDEQAFTAAALTRGPWPASTAESFDTADWPRLLATTAARSGTDWTSWNDGQGPTRAAAAIARIARATDAAPVTDAGTTFATEGAGGASTPVASIASSGLGGGHGPFAQQTGPRA